MEVFLGTKHKDNSVVSIAADTRRKHMAIFGKSGVGKTTLMRNMIFADLHNGNGITVVDPHGSLIEDSQALAVQLPLEAVAQSRTFPLVL